MSVAKNPLPPLIPVTALATTATPVPTVCDAGFKVVVVIFASMKWTIRKIYIC